MSWRTAHRQLRAEANARHLDLGDYLAVSSDPTPATVFLEDWPRWWAWPWRWWRCCCIW